MEDEAIDVTVRPWADLVPDLLRQISGSIQDVADYGLVPEPVCSDSHSSIAQFRSIFSKTKTKTILSAHGTYSHRHCWLGTENGKGTWLLTAGRRSSPRLVDPFTGSSTALPPFPVIIRDNFPSIDGIFCADGTVFLYAIADFRYILAAVLRPGDPAWTSAQTYLTPNAMVRKCTAAYHGGSIVLVIPNHSHIQMVRLHMTGVEGRNGSLVTEILMTKSYDGVQLVLVPQARRQSIHIFESRGKLLAASVILAISPEARDLDSALSVRIYDLEPEPESVDGWDHRQRWIRRDGLSLMNDRVLFLGHPTSFAVDAVGGGGGYAYFVLNSRNAGWIGRIVPEASRVYRYSFKDGRATEVEELPLGAGWRDDTAMMWIAPRLSAMAPANIFYGNVLRLKKQSAKRRPKGPFVMPLLAQNTEA
ncbi:hypothetical protein QOZ80_6AG0525690 [Eleusine coracana subsp. coracana]|nr:hypothetical protein QOZ80_6AG0525690 [Eleusine coracana subsp. coracana]